MKRRSKLLVTAIFALAALAASVSVVSVTSRPLPPLRLLDSPEDYARLRLTPTITAREDARRSRANTDDFEWWYLDGVAEDGTIVVIWFGDNWLVGTHQRRIVVDVTAPGRARQNFEFATSDAGSFSQSQTDVRIGHSRFVGDLDRYRIVVDRRDIPGFACDLTLTRRYPSFRVGTGYIASGDDYFAWLAAVPEGELSGTLELDGRTKPFLGSGYHDHNWGNVPPWDLLRSWWWGRGKVGDRTVVASDLRATRRRAGGHIPILYVAAPDHIDIAGHSSSVRFAEREPAAHGDPARTDLTASAVTFAMSSPDGGTHNVEFRRRGAPIDSTDVLSKTPRLARWVGRLRGDSPWYSRWPSAVTLRTGQESASGLGTLEFMDLE